MMLIAIFIYCRMEVRLMKKHRGILKAKSQIIKKKTNKIRTIHSKDLGDPNRNLEKDFVLKGHFFPQDDIFPAD